MITDDTAKVTYVGDGAITTFTIPFEFTADSSGAYYIKVLVNGVVKIQDQDFTLPQNNPFESTAGVIVFTTAPANGASIIITRKQPVIQTLDISNDSRLPLSSIENEFDYLTECIQMVRQTFDDYVSNAVYSGDQTAIAAEFADIDSRLTTIETAIAPIPSMLTNISNLQGRMTTAETNIAANTSAINTNATNIAANTANISTINTKINQAVVTDISVSGTDEDVTLTESKKNLGTGVVTTENTELPYASETAAGILAASDYETIINTSQTIDEILGGSVSVSNLSATPTQAEILAAWQAASGKTTPLNNASCFDSVNGIQYRYYSNTGEWTVVSNLGTGGVTVQQATDTQLGIVKGKADAGDGSTDGYQTVNGNGELYTIGFGALKTATNNNTSAIANNTSAIATNTANIATNTANIATNTDNITSNTSAIESLDSQVTQLSSNKIEISNLPSALSTMVISTTSTTADITTTTVDTATGNVTTATQSIPAATSSNAGLVQQQYANALLYAYNFFAYNKMIPFGLPVSKNEIVSGNTTVRSSITWTCPVTGRYWFMFWVSVSRGSGGAGNPNCLITSSGSSSQTIYSATHSGFGLGGAYYSQTYRDITPGVELVAGDVVTMLGGGTNLSTATVSLGTSIQLQPYFRPIVAASIPFG